MRRKIRIKSKKNKKSAKKKREQIDKKEEGRAYQVKCMDCDKVYIQETKFKIKKESGSTQERRAVQKHLLQLGDEIDKGGTKCLEKEKITIPRKKLEGCHIIGNRKICTNLNEVLNVRAQYVKEAWIWRRRKRQEGINITGSRPSVHPVQSTEISLTKCF